MKNSELNSFLNSEKINRFDVLNSPEIEIKYEKGEMLLSLLLRGYKRDFGVREHELSIAVDRFFKENPLEEETVEFLKENKVLEDDGTDSETLFNMALTYENEDRKKALSEILVMHKKHIHEPEKLREKLMRVLADLENKLPENLKEKLKLAVIQDLAVREQKIDNIKQKIDNLIDFFKPNQTTTKTGKVVFLPTNFLMPEKSGVAFNFGKELFISSNINNPDNFEHEFLHCVINPIIEKLEKQLTKDQKEKIINFANTKLKQDYGEECFSILCEEFIRTYNDVFKKGKKPQTEKEFVENISRITEVRFQNFLIENESLRERCEALGIKSVNDLKNNSKEYFERFEKNCLREIIFEFYQEYSMRRDEESVNFEKFVLEKFSDKIK